MHFTGRIRTIWSWLPAFRAVAETEHLPTAGQELDVAPSSLSRTLKLLEDELGLPLFDRTAKTLVLNEAGRRLLAATRDAMRIVDEALVSATGDEMRGTIAAVASPDLAYAVLPRACAALANRHPDICASVMIDHDANVGSMLMRGDVDVALVLEPPDSAELVTSEAASWTRGVYARAGKTVDTAAMRCVVVGTPDKHADDGWPSRSERQIAAWTSDQRAALEMVARTGLVTVAFDAVARTSDVFKRLIRIPTPHLEPRTLYLVQRRSVGAHRRTEALVDAIRHSLTRLAT
jgi:DNA-binding transcriptional LysR family regulator